MAFATNSNSATKSHNIGSNAMLLGYQARKQQSPTPNHNPRCHKQSSHGLRDQTLPTAIATNGNTMANSPNPMANNLGVVYAFIMRVLIRVFINTSFTIFLRKFYTNAVNKNKIILGDNLPHLTKMKSQSVDLIYIDPPFNSGVTQARNRIRTERDENGDRVGFGGHRYKTIKETKPANGFADDFGDDFMSFIVPRLKQAHRILKATGSLFFHIDYREAHYCKVELDKIFGRACFINEIIWSYDYGARAKNRWSPKHDNILWYAKEPKNYTYNYDAIDRIPYMAPELVGEEKAARGKTPTDVWWNTIVSPTGKEKTGYPTQKPLKILERIIKVHSNEGDLILDFFGGSGTTGLAAKRNNRHYILIDKSPEAITIMKKRLAKPPQQQSR